MRLAKKEQIVKNLHERFQKTKIVIVTDYKGLDVTTLNGLRRRLKDANCEYQVTKNTLLVRASEDTDIALLKDIFKGPNAIALSYDNPVDPAKVLTEFAKSNDKLDIKAGVMDGKVLDANAIRALSALPPREVLLSTLLSAMNGVPAAFLRVLNGVPQQMLNVLLAIKEQKTAS